MLKYIYFGTPVLSREVLSELIEIYNKPVCIVTAQERPSGRGLKMTPTPVYEYGIEYDIPVFTPEKLKDIEIELKSYNADIGVLFAYGKIIPQWLLDLFPYGIINVHPSLLPLYRGASPLTGPILNGETETGITIMDMDNELDHGDIYLQNKIQLEQNTDRIILENYVINTAPKMLKNVIDQIELKKIDKIKQDHTQATYTTKIKKSDGEIFQTDTDEAKYRKYCAYIGWPGIYYIDENNLRIKITQAHMDNDKFIIDKIIPEGNKEINYSEFLSNNSF